MKRLFSIFPPLIRVGVLRFLWVLFAYFVSRLFFLCWNLNLFANDSSSDIARAFLHGIVFDISAIFFTNAILILLWLLPSRILAMRAVAILDRTLFIILNFIAVGLNFIDVEFIRFIGKRFSYEYIALHQDVEEQSLGIFLIYWKFFVGLVILIGVLGYMYPQFEAEKENWITGIVWRLVTIGLVVLGMRGGFGFKPLHPMDAYFTNKPEIGLLTLNTPFNVIKTRRSEEIVAAKYFSDNAEAFSKAKMMTEPTRPALAIAKKFNVVVLIVESLSTEDVGVANSYPGYTPFLDELSKKSYFFEYNFANARRSIDGVPAVLCGLPALMPESIVMSDFVKDRLDCFPKILKEQGYESWFLHGAHNGSFHFDAFSNIAGFDHFVGRNEFPYRDEANFDPYWGVMDQPMLQYAAELMDRATKPMMLSVFTLSSHNPYYIPPILKGTFPKGDNVIYESIGYADYSLRKFFETAQKKPWFNKTIFVITGDHTHATDRPEYSANVLGVYRVPLFIYVPGALKKIDVSPTRITQHIDVLPSVLDLLGLRLPQRLLIGESVFDKGLPGRAYNSWESMFWYIDPELVATYERHGEKASLFDYSHDRLMNFTERNIAPTEARQAPQVQNLLAIAQYFDQGLIDNTLYDWQKILEKQKDAANR
jgi:uncharacterized sulfatase